MPKVLGGFDVIFDDEGAVAELASQCPGEERIGGFVQTAAGEKSRILG